MRVLSQSLTVVTGVVLIFSGCQSVDTSIFGGSFGRNSSAMTAGGAVAGQDYVIGLKPSEAAQQYFASASLSSGASPVTVTPGDDKGTGVVWTDDGGITIPPGTTIEFTNKGCCLDPHLPAPKADEEMQFIRTSCLIPAQLQGTYRNLLRRAAAGDEDVKSNLQHLMWTLRTAGSNDAYAKNLTDRQREILAECADGGSFDGYCQDLQRFDGLKKLVMAQVNQVAEKLQVEIGNVTYKVSDLLDPELGKQKVAAHLGELIHMNEYLPVVKSGFNFGELEKGIYTDIKGNGTLSFKAKVANSTSEPFVFYPMDYVAQVGSGQSMQGAFFAAADSTMKQRTTTGEQDEVEVEKKEVPVNDDVVDWNSLPCSVKRALLRNAYLALDSYADLSSYNKDGVRGVTTYEIGGREFADAWSQVFIDFNNSHYGIAGSDDAGLAAGLYRDQDGIITLVFRGSDGMQDWVYDNPSLMMGVESEQLKYARRLVALLSTTGQKFNVVGHSLGGYLAVASVLGQSANVNKVYTYNAPGIDSAILRRYPDVSNDVAIKTTNLWDRRDSVHNINNSGSDKHIGTNAHMSNWAGFLDWFLPHLPFHDHSIHTLIDRMKANMGGCSF